MIRSKYFWAFTIIPLTELFILVYMSDIIGTGVTVLIVVLTAIMGTMLIKNTGKEVMQNLQNAMMMQGSLTDAIVDGAMLIVSGVLLLTPGFFTDIFALLIHVPVINGAVKRFLIRKFKDKIMMKTGADFGSMNDGMSGGMGGFANFGNIYNMEDFQMKDFQNQQQQKENQNFDGKTIEVKDSQDDYYV